ncbi:MAG: pyridoxal 5'-phosphate synthase glutaminase subunit PdxT, partial [Planctomycetia bacterium]|nr:pyridoxal 5'-phosphate synthase glutaminase subunit PdxT [Planctomycetia bacterium]
SYSLPASFIRAPKIISYGSSTEVLAMSNGSPIIIRNDKHLGIAFHPELDNISALHEYIFIGRKTNK